MSAALKPLDIPSRNVAAMPRALAETGPRRAACLFSGWRVIEADEPRRVEDAQEWLEARDFQVYAPQFPVWIKNTTNGRRDPNPSWCWRPRFFQYFFANLGDEIIRPDLQNSIRRSPGWRVDAALIDWLRSDEAQRRDDLETLERRRRRQTPFQPGALVVVKTTPIGIDKFGADRYHHFAGQVVTVEKCDGRTTVGYVTMFGGRVRSMFARGELSDE